MVGVIIWFVYLEVILVMYDDGLWYVYIYVNVYVYVVG